MFTRQATLAIDTEIKSTNPKTNPILNTNENTRTNKNTADTNIKNTNSQSDIHDEIKVVKDYRQIINIMTWITTVSIGILASTCPDFFSQYLALPLTVFLIVCIGIPHGSIDHILYYEECRRKLDATEHNLYTFTETFLMDSNGSLTNLNIQHLKQGKTSTQKEKKEGDVQIEEKLLMKMKRERFRVKSEFLFRFYFYWNFLIIMGLWGLSWYMAPQFAFWMFLFVSAYHFGESDLDYLNLSKPWSTLFYLSRGLFLIGEVACSKMDITLPIIRQLIGQPKWITLFSSHSNIVRSICIFQHTLLLCMFLLSRLFNIQYPIFSKSNNQQKDGLGNKINQGQEEENSSSYPVWTQQITFPTLMTEIVKCRLFIWLFQILDPLTGFAVYFGLWHALGSTLCEIGFLEPGFKSHFSNDIRIQDTHLNLFEKYSQETSSGDIQIRGSVNHFKAFVSFFTIQSRETYLMDTPESLKSKTENDEQQHHNHDHGLNSTLNQNDKIVTIHGIRKFISLSFAFTFISILGMFMLYFLFSSRFGKTYTETGLVGLTEIWVVFIISISILTGPHIWVIFLLHQPSGSTNDHKSSRWMDPLSGDTLGGKVFEWIESQSWLGVEVIERIIRYF